MDMPRPSYDNCDLSILRTCVREANLRIQPWQARVSPGDYFEFETSSSTPGISEVLQCNREAPLRNYVTCAYYTEQQPRGRVGDLHMSLIVRFLMRTEFASKLAQLQSTGN